MTPSKTATGQFLIGFRRGGGDWQKPTGALARWAVEHGFGFVDIGKDNPSADLHMLGQTGLSIGQVDLLGWDDYQVLIAPDSDERKAAVTSVSAHVETCAQAGATNFFCVTVPADKQRSRRENFGYLVESFAALLPALERTGSRVAIEGWPGPGAVCCTPETYRAFFREVGSDRFGINYDPSHLWRMGIDPLRFLKEFADRVYHVHAKDTALSPEGLYEFGHELPPTLATVPRWGGGTWRYTVPGLGQTDWVETFRTLRTTGYQGLVSIELEDENFNGSEDGERRGLITSREFLEGC